MFEYRDATDAELRGIVGGLSMATKFVAEQWGGGRERLAAGRYRRINSAVARQSVGPGAGSPPLFPRAVTGGTCANGVCS